jgi:DNA polymerase-4
MKNNVKIIFHIDLNAFFCSCAVIKEPYLKDKVFVVGGSSISRRGVVSTSNYLARKYGIHSAMSMNDAFRLYPKLLVVPTDFKLYRKYSRIFFEYLKSYSDLILPGSIDEAYVDMTEASKTKHPMDLAKEIQQGLYEKHQLPCSIGIAPTLFLAKMASDMKKPMGITVLRKKDIVNKLFNLPIKDMFGIGKKTYPKLMELGVMTIGDFTKDIHKEKILSLMSEQSYQSYLEHILGKSSDVIDPDKYGIAKSISNETTFNYPMDEYDAVFEMIEEQLKTSYQRLIKEELVCRTVGIRLRDTDFNTITRSITFDEYTDDYDMIHDQILNLFDKHYKNQPIRLAGASLSQLLLKKDLKIDITLFNYQEFTKREEKLFKKQ